MRQDQKMQENRKKTNRNALISIGLVGGSALVSVFLLGAPVKPWVLLLLFASPFFFLPLCLIAGIVIGHIALRQINKNKEKGRLLALFSVVFGYFVIGMSVLSLLLSDFVAH